MQNAARGCRISNEATQLSPGPPFCSREIIGSNWEEPVFFEGG